jgi:hypothetical protein
MSEDDWCTPCSDRDCVMRTERPSGMTTSGGCQHLKERPPSYALRIRTLMAELTRLRAIVAAADALRDATLQIQRPYLCARGACPCTICTVERAINAYDAARGQR